MATTEEIQNQALVQADGLTNDARALLANVQSLLNTGYTDPFGSFEPPPINNGYYGLFEAAEDNKPATPVLPEFNGIAPPVVPVMPQVDVPSLPNVPTFDMAAPIVTIPPAPSSALPAAPGSSPEFVTPAIPTAPDYVLPPAPVFAPVEIPVPPSVTIPYFEMEADFGEVIAPTEQFQWSEQEYQSVLLDATKAKILNDILNGGYGIDDADERRLWDRARERELMNANARIEEFGRVVAARGFNIPPGSFYAMQESVQQDLLEKNSSLSRDIAVKKADMYVENRRFAITSAIQIEQMMITYFGGVAERALNAARAQTEFGIAIFNAQLARYSAKVQAYAVYAQAFEAQVRASLAGVEIYKAQVEGARLAVQVQQVHAEVYNTQIEGVTALMNLYRVEMEGAKTAAEIETLKLQAFRTQVEAYAAQVQARVAEFQMFESQVRGEMAKVDVYRTSAQAYNARVNGIEAQARIANTTVQAQTTNATLVLETYKTDMERYRNEVSVVSERVRSQLQKYGTDVAAYGTQMEAYRGGAQVDQGADRIRVDAYVAQMNATFARLDAQVKNFVNYLNVIAGNANQAAQTTASLGASWASNVTGLSATIENNDA
jgi:hypothetical protein